VFIVGNQLDTGVMVRLAMGVLLNGIKIIGDKFISEIHRHFWTKDTIGHLGVGIHICYGDRKWDNHSFFLFFIVLRRSDLYYFPKYS